MRTGISRRSERDQGYASRLRISRTVPAGSTPWSCDSGTTTSSACGIGFGQPVGRQDEGGKRRLAAQDRHGNRDPIMPPSGSKTVFASSAS